MRVRERIMSRLCKTDILIHVYVNNVIICRRYVLKAARFPIFHIEFEKIWLSGRRLAKGAHLYSSKRYQSVGKGTKMILLTRTPGHGNLSDFVRVQNHYRR